jgi:XTP/dITP diphosphohydrolase
MALMREENLFFIVQETLEGEIVKKSGMKGDGGFGYDPVFWIPSLRRTLAELSAEEKNSMSHRGKAGKHIAELLKNLIS